MSVMTLVRDQTPQPAGLVWENPPERTQPGKYAPIAAALRERPGQWAVVKTLPKDKAKSAWSWSNHVKSGKYADFRADDRGHFEAVARSADGQARVYVRFMPAAP